MRIELEGYMIEGTPEEMLELLDLLAEEVAAVEDPVQVIPEKPKTPKPKPKKPAQKKSGGVKQVDWNKAVALRKAGWPYTKIGEELGISDVTVAAHLKPLGL